MPQSMGCITLMRQVCRLKNDRFMEAERTDQSLFRILNKLLVQIHLA